ncbi:hypothetical protein L841_0078 [Mycobacterium sp. MAC_080597_8934]|uniref:hypothetical protein n=1 Tax=unclassified Mycobacterium avium complex (MAC) TaxID=2750822 RepID=UPI000448DEAA|nr:MULTISPECIES: hypothetical protein [unclassified Mycobacterium avium complex (MAC)]ETZ58165.1 hypothetical protein L840_2867 [Mycobacterium sp. MAC_011194_8550]ETZ75120.1 hypothetical protein L841_0078 [Mycobacterium sp. MAC_080597_8934]
MSDTEVTTEATDTELSPDEALDIAVKATAAAEYQDAFRPPAHRSTDQTDQAADEQPDGAEGDGDDNPNHEAAKWRTKLRDAESQNTALAAQLENMQRAAIDTQVTAFGIKPAAFWASGAEIADLLNDAGVPDPEKVQKAAAAAKDTLGLMLNRPRPKPRLGELRSGAMAHAPKRDKWVEAFGPRGGE